ncbi:helix-hairpin-helix DNA-binding motif-containing protein [Bifidobacterium callitrichos DSM 23973]|uniref:Helix-hairpin-helix DNA-binding motif-containing protein n=2 Tax=Bifidobacterium callitrichos TaxID=762209 RepID=A0A086ZY51_9BIFI|nr:helix-hairpin-helix DNA-binding motif-containing protein [Bifidobacterium callitrichos DSM 23973]
MQYKDLAEKLAEVGRPLTPVAIRDAENGKRKVDVDDLMALAIVFEVSPLTLLLPESGSRDITTRITGYPDEMGSNVAWLWARGDEPLELPQDPALSDHSGNDRAIALFRLHARPEIQARNMTAGVTMWLPDDAEAATQAEKAALVESARRSDAQLIRGSRG